MWCLVLEKSGVVVNKALDYNFTHVHSISGTLWARCHEPVDPWFCYFLFLYFLILFIVGFFITPGRSNTFIVKL
jgi:hypothetical protein